MEISMSKPVLIDFSAKWCGPCKRQTPILEKLKEQMGDAIELRVIDVDENIEEAVKYGIRVVPTLVVEKDGQIIRTIEGVTYAEELEAILSPLVD
jgi:thioredoxin 1